MTLPANLRRQVMLASEAAIIKGAADASDDASVEVAQCQIDGMLNKKRMGNVTYAFVFPDHLEPDPKTGKIRMVLSAGNQ